MRRIPPTTGTLLICVILAVAHTCASWGHIPIFWGDSGRWLHEVERFAEGERLYRDFTWPFPPFALWVLGLAARVLGTNLAPVWLVTTFVFLVTCIVFVQYAQKVAPPDIAPWIAVGGLLWAIAYAQVGGAPLPLGTYTPAALVGGLCLLIAVSSLVHVFHESVSVVPAAVLGISVSLAVLTKQDFWLPASTVTLLALGKTPRHLRLTLVLAAVIPAAIGYGVVLTQLGIAGFIEMVGGFGHVAEFGGWGLPSGYRVAAELATLSGAIAIALVVTGSNDRRWWIAVIVMLVVPIVAYEANDPGGLHALETETRLRGLSLFLPALVLVWIWRTRQHADPRPAQLAGALLIVAIAARARRGFHHLEWYHVLLELPAYFLALRVVLGETRVWMQRYAAMLLIPAGIYLYWHLGNGHLTSRGAQIPLITMRGRIYTNANAIGDYYAISKVVSELDSLGERPLFAFGYSGGWNYFLKRHNPTPAPQGFRLTLIRPESTLARASRAAPIVIDARVFTRIKVDDNWAGVFHWRPPRRPSHYMLFDRPYFDRLIERCMVVGRHPPAPASFFVVYSCG